MKIAMFARYAPDPATVELLNESGRLDTERLLFKLGRADLAALEIATQLAESTGGQVAAFCVAPASAEKLLKTLYAGGASEVTRLWSGSNEDSLPEMTQAYLLAGAVKAGGFDLVVGGAAGSEGNSDVIGPALAAYLNLPQIGNVVKLEPRDQKQFYVERKLERGEREALLCPLPALLTMAEGSIEPRYPAMPAYLASLRRPINFRKAELRYGSSGDASPVEVKSMSLTPPRPRPKKLPRPDDTLPYHKRIEAILAVTGGEKKGNIYEGSPEEMADKILAFLESNKFI